MSTDNKTDDGDSQTEEEADKKYNKEVTFVAYSGISGEVPDREALDEMFKEVDCTSKEATTEETYHLVAGESDVELDAEDFRELDGFDLGEAELEVRKEETERHVNDLYYIQTYARDLLESGLPEEFGESFRKLSWGPNWTAGAEGKVSLKLPQHTKMGLLKHPSEISSDDVWEDKEQVEHVIQYRIKASNLTEEEMDEANSEIFEAVPEVIPQMGWVERVRFTDCCKEVKKEGVCYGL